jgi:hypothetical protein
LISTLTSYVPEQLTVVPALAFSMVDTMSAFARPWVSSKPPTAIAKYLTALVHDMIKTSKV